MRRQPLVLTAVRGPALGLCWELTGTRVLGRAGDIAVDDVALSRHHLRLRARGRTVRCADAGSANGSYRRALGVRRRIGCTWTAVTRSTVLEAGSGAYRVTRRPGPLRERRWGADALARVLVPLAMAAAMVPFALGGPPWRWVLIAAPLAGAVLLLRGTTAEIMRSSHPAHVLLASREGRAFHAEPVVPRELRTMRRPLGGTGWCIPGEDAEQRAIWLAGFLAVHNDPDVLRVTSPWLTTYGSGLEVRFDPRGTGPTTGQAMVTWLRTPQWAMVLRPPAWAAAGPAWARALARAREESPAPVRAAVPGPGEIRRRWERSRADLAVPLGVDEDGPVVIDLAGDGPHALVAGMSGSGKSELLTTWLLELAQRNAPTLLHLILVDFKGGAAFNHLEALPHCVGVLTDLDAGSTTRALASLRAQLRVRKRRIAARGCREVQEFNRTAPDPLPLVLVVIDEFRALSLDHPELMEQFLHLANQGRSLGIHLIAATQRPAGAVGPDLRANMPLRICLRVAEAADSLDVLGVPDAARLDPVPGRGLVLRDGLRPLQVVWSGDGETVRHTVSTLAAAWDGPPATPLWCPPLPRLIPPTACDPTRLGLADEPDELRQRPVGLPAALLVLGHPRSGRSTTAARAAAVAAAEGDEVWLVTSDGSAAGVDACNTRVVGRVLRHLSVPGGDRTLVLDDVELWMDAHDALHGAGSAAAVLGEFIRTARATGTRVVVTAPPDLAHARWAAPLSTRLHLRGVDAASAVAAGVPRSLVTEVTGPLVPGRGVILPDGVVVQVAQAPPGPTGSPPWVLPAASEPAPRPGEVVLGTGAEGTCSVPATGDITIIGPPGTGRTSLARLVHDQYPGSALHDGESTEGHAPAVVTVTPGAFTGAAWSPALARLREAETIILLRPDLFPRIPGIDYSTELEPGSPGYGIVIHRGRAVALRLARSLATPSVAGQATVGDVGPGGRRRERPEDEERQSGGQGGEPRQQLSQADHREKHEEVSRDEHPA